MLAGCWGKAEIKAQHIRVWNKKGDPAREFDFVGAINSIFKDTYLKQLGEMNAWLIADGRTSVLYGKLVKRG